MKSGLNKCIYVLIIIYENGFLYTLNVILKRFFPRAIIFPAFALNNGLNICLFVNESRNNEPVSCSNDL